jgi:isopentenyl diphosphate isomerase/L-lactate dehydrogenase-like FMN-dependent dehydrogenase
VLKGICHPDDARRAVDAGIDGLAVRQIEADSSW